MGSLLYLFEDYPVTAIKDKRTVDWNNTSCSGSITRLTGFDTAPCRRSLCTLVANEGGGTECLTLFRSKTVTATTNSDLQVGPNPFTDITEDQR